MTAFTATERDSYARLLGLLRPQLAKAAPDDPGRIALHAAEELFAVADRQAAELAQQQAIVGGLTETINRLDADNNDLDADNAELSGRIQAAEEKLAESGVVVTR